MPPIPICNTTVGPATYMARVAELLGYRPEPTGLLEAYGQGITAELYAAGRRPPEPMVLRPFDVQDHSDDGRIDCHSATGEFLSREAIEVELKRLGIPYTIAKE